jgi:hypothetical protein
MNNFYRVVTGAAPTPREQQERRPCGTTGQPLKIEQLRNALALEPYTVCLVMLMRTFRWSCGAARRRRNRGDGRFIARGERARFSAQRFSSIPRPKPTEQEKRHLLCC